MEEPPSVLDVEVFDFDGPFDQATSLGHAEINFVKHTSTELADMWIPLEGKLAQSSQLKLHLRMFVDNNKGVEMIREYLKKMEKEVGKKVSPSTLVSSLLMHNNFFCCGGYFPHVEMLNLCHNCLLTVESTITSQEFNIPKTIYIATRRVSHQ